MEMETKDDKDRAGRNSPGIDWVFPDEIIPRQSQMNNALDSSETPRWIYVNAISLLYIVISTQIPAIC